jgi:hypothetical protein
MILTSRVQQNHNRTTKILQKSNQESKGQCRIRRESSVRAGLFVDISIYKTYLTYFGHNHTMESEMVCAYCKQKTDSLFGLFDMMVCSNCHIRLVNSLKYVGRV